MKVFVSYSFSDSELHFLTLLLDKLRSEGHVVETSGFYYGGSIRNDDDKIYNSSLFLGIITNNSNSVNEVVSQWKIAQNYGIKSILIIENGIRVEDPEVKFIRFDRNNPQATIDQLFNKSQPNRALKLRKKAGDDWADNLLVGAGIVVGVAALIALLGGDGKK